MKRLVPLLLLVLLTGCGTFQGRSTGGTTREFTDKAGRHCTAVKWGDSASVDCDYPKKKR